MICRKRYAYSGLLSASLPVSANCCDFRTSHGPAKLTDCLHLTCCGHPFERAFPGVETGESPSYCQGTNQEGNLKENHFVAKCPCARVASRQQYRGVLLY